MKSTALRNQAERLRDGLEYLGDRPWLSFLLIFSLAAAVRFALLSTAPAWAVRGHAEAESIAFTLATQGRFADPFGVPTGPTAFTAPFYPFVLSLVYRVLGTGIAAEWVRCAMGILAYSILYGLLPRISTLFRLSGGAGVVAGFAMAALPLRKSDEVYLTWDDPYAAICLAFLLIWTLRLKRQDRPAWPQAALYGIGWGAVFHMAPTLAVTFLGLAAYLLVSSRDRWRCVRWVALAILLSVLAVTPWTLRNRRELGGWMFMRSNLGLNLYLSNSDAAQPTIGLHHLVPFGLRDIHPFGSENETRRVAYVGEVAYDREKLSLAKEWIAAHPRRFASLCAMRAAQMWFGAFETPPWLRLPIAAFTILGLLGLRTLWRSSRVDQLAVIAILWLTYPTVYFVFMYVNRYRGVFDWSVALCMGVFLISALDRTRERMGAER